MYTLHHGDCRDILPTITGIDAIIADPPYGIDNDADYTRFQACKSFRKHNYAAIDNDAEPFDPSHLLGYPQVILWGWQYFAGYLPMGTTLIWIKKPDSMFGTFFSDAEMAWAKGGHGTYVLQYAWMGSIREGEQRTIRSHPNQKPIRIMEWCIERLDLPIGATVCDPYMGSGTTGVACARMGYNFVGIESNAEHYEHARRRVANAYGDITPTVDDDRRGQPTLFDSVQ